MFGKTISVNNINKFIILLPDCNININPTNWKIIVLVHSKIKMVICMLVILNKGPVSWKWNLY